MLVKRKLLIWHVLLSVAAGFLILLYYRITRCGSPRLDVNSIWKSLLIGLAFFVGSGVLRRVCSRFILPQIGEGYIGKAYGLIFLFCVLVSIAGILVYKKLRYGFVHISSVSLLSVLGLGIALFAIFCGILQITKQVLKETPQGFSFSTSELRTTLFCMIAAAICFIPVASDHITQQFPVAYGVPTIVNSHYLSGEREVVGEITRDNRISQTFLCSSKGIYAVTMEGATYVRHNSGMLQITMVDENTGETIEEWTLDAANFENNSEFTVYSSNPSGRMDLQGRTLRLDIRSEEATPGNALTLYYVKQDYYANGDLLINEMPIEGDLEMCIQGVSGPSNQERIKVMTCLIFAVMIGILLLFVARKHAGRNAKYKENA